MIRSVDRAQKGPGLLERLFGRRPRVSLPPDAARLVVQPEDVWSALRLDGS